MKNKYKIAISIIIALLILFFVIPNSLNIIS